MRKGVSSSLLQAYIWFCPISPLLTIATASLFLHRFYMLESLKKYGAREVALACLFLAGKVEESLRKVDTVVNYCLRLEDRRKGKEPDVHPSSEVSHSNIMLHSHFIRQHQTHPLLDMLYDRNLKNWSNKSFS